MPQPFPFTKSSMDRAGVERRDAAWLQRQLGAPATRFLPLWKLQVLVRTRSEAGLAWARGEIRESMDEGVGPVLLGMREGIAHFAVDVSPLAEPEKSLGVQGLARFEDARSLAARLPVEETGIVAQAKSLVDWHSRHRHCPACGEATRPAEGGYMRVCPDCSAEHFPRTDPVAIMLVHRGQRCLLGRQASWPPRMYSALAGFVEPGETLEDAVRREVHEESGVRVGAVRYVASQAWPFPSSLMLGCLAEAETESLRVDEGELEEARWFSRDVARAALDPEGGSSELLVPPPLAIAHHLIRAWASG